MRLKYFLTILGLLASGVGLASGETEAAAAVKPALVVVVPVREQLDGTALRAVRAGAQVAIDRQAAAILLDVDASNGTAEALKGAWSALERFPGTVLAYVNTNAVGEAAALTLGAHEIYFAPTGVLSAGLLLTTEGATTGAEAANVRAIEATNSWVEAKLRAGADDARLAPGLARAALWTALTRPSKAWQLDDGTALKAANETFSLAATDALRRVGQPPLTMLAAGKAATPGELLAQRFAAAGFATIDPAGRPLSVPGAPVAAVAAARAAPAIPAGEVERAANTTAPATTTAGASPKVFVVPMKEVVSEPTLFILRRGVKQAMAEGIDYLVLDMDTPGGDANVTLEILEVLAEFPGTVLTFINPNAGSAGAIIALTTHEVHFQTRAAMGAAALVATSGEEIEATMRAKIESFYGARFRAFLGDARLVNGRYRQELVDAMSRLDYTLTIDGVLLKEEGKLMSLTAEDALRKFGNPPQPLLAAGKHENLEAFLRTRFGEGASITKFEVTWSEQLAQWLTGIAPILVSLGFFLIIIELRMGVFGPLSMVGLLFLGVAFMSNFVAGLAGWEPFLILGFGLLLILLDLFVFGGSTGLTLVGGAFLFLAMVWSFSDVWQAPATNEGGGFNPTGLDFRGLESAFVTSVFTLAGTLVLSLIAFKYLPKTPLGSWMVLKGAVAAPDAVAVAGGDTDAGAAALPALGAKGIAMTDLRPGGEVEVNGQIFQATVEGGTLRRGTRVVVVAYRTFALLVAEDISAAG